MRPFALTLNEIIIWDYNHLIMLHRHINQQQFSLAAIDDIIARGKKKDWIELRNTVLSDRDVLEKVMRVCQVYITDPYAQRYHFWKQYAERLLA